MSTRAVTLAPPYPRLGEVLRTLLGAFDMKGDDPRIDRFARDGDYDCELFDIIRRERLIKPLAKWIGDDFADFLCEQIDYQQEMYVGLINRVPLDALTRTEAWPVLLQHFFLPNIAAFLQQLHQRWPGPIAELVTGKRPALAVVLEWIEGSSGHSLATLCEFGDVDVKLKSDQIKRWQRSALPDFGSLKLLANALDDGHRVDSGVMTSVKPWLLIARGLDWAERRSPDLLAQTGNALSALQILASPDVGLALSLFNEEHAQPLAKVRDAWPDSYRYLMGTMPKLPGDQARAASAIYAFAAAASDDDPKGLASFMIWWHQGRFEILSGRAPEAMALFEKALKQAIYRSGHARDIWLDYMALAASQEHRTRVTALIHLGATMLWRDFPESTGVTAIDAHSRYLVEDDEMAFWQRAFDLRFPASGYFVESTA